MDFDLIHIYIYIYIYIYILNLLTHVDPYKFYIIFKIDMWAGLCIWIYAWACVILKKKSLMEWGSPQLPMAGEK